MVEFSAYKSHKKLVERMVDRDLPRTAIWCFYTNLTAKERRRGMPPVKFIPNIKNALRWLKRQPTGIVATQIRFPRYDDIDNTQNDRHALCLVKDPSGSYYLFDPNGVINHTGNNLYALEIKDSLPHRGLLTVKQLVDRIKAKFRITFLYNAKSGIQVEYVDTPKDLNYILNGGYCMFYNYFFIHWVLAHWGPMDLIKSVIIPSIHVSYTHSSGVFPQDMAAYSLKIIKRVFKPLTGPNYGNCQPSYWS
jgi:hypothetical protein